MSEKRSIRCAIYTRKSTEEGLDQDFNSLDAQREACEAYIVSQRHEGWKLVRGHFDDGGFSGGNMDRPALADLLASIDRGEIDVIVVYKVDRLTRSLADFAKIVERLDARGVSFVSVTQQFNTTSSMGRLTLNVLLSFAQFEREVTAERIRDKIAASRKKGMWTGGPTPIGYDVIDKKLVVNEQEAQTVRMLFNLFLELGNVRALKDEADRRGIATKRRTQKNGRVVGGRPFSRGNLYQLLSNPIYIGRVRYQDETYEGEQDAIIDQATWEAVQDLLSGNAPDRSNDTNTKSASLLTGLICDETGDRLSPVHATKSGKRYRYYISKRLMHHADRHKNGWRIPAREIERAVVNQITELLSDQHRMMGFFPKDEITIDAAANLDARAAALIEQLAGGSGTEAQLLIQQVIQKIDIGNGTIDVTYDKSELGNVLGLPASDSNEDDQLITTTAPFEIRRRGVEAKLVIPGSSTGSNEPDANLVRLVAQTRFWFEELATGKTASVYDIAELERLNTADVSRVLPLAFLAPDIITKILSGDQPAELTAYKLKTIKALPSDWQAQRLALGFE